MGVTVMFHLSSGGVLLGHWGPQMPGLPWNSDSQKALGGEVPGKLSQNQAAHSGHGGRILPQPSSSVSLDGQARSLIKNRS